MTIKFYKKKVHWYFKYQGQEYCIDNDSELNALNDLLNKNGVIYVKVQNDYNGNLGFHLYHYSFTDWYEMGKIFKTFFKLITKEFTYFIKIPKQLLSIVPFHLYILDIY